MTAARPLTNRAEFASPRNVAIGGAALFGLLLWSYWPVLVPLWGDWRRDPNYSVGMLVPLAAIWLAWTDRSELARLSWTPTLWGFLLLAGALLMRLAGQLLMFESLERYSIVVALAGLIGLFGGVAALRRTAGILALLLLMVPLPGRIHNAISPPLQQVAASMATDTLELFGVAVLREGYSLTVNNRATVNIAEGCSGLRLLTAFLVVSAVFALLVRRPLWQQMTLVISAVPIAIACNVLRICVTAFLYANVSSRAGEIFFHDFAGVSMMPLAVLLLWGELRVLDWLVERPVPATRGVPAA